uniref:Reverse transcriptase zinc-binding domain-containing protein n=1 Tax=Cannabis sativa TaxID=3483 RepID=A0A803QCU3_CANSA
MVALKDQIRDMVDFDAFQKQKYSVAAGYKLFSPPVTRLYWSKEAWSRLNIPKHSVIAWLAMLNRLKTQDRLMQFGLHVQGTCCLCELQLETCQHLFFECSVAEKCLQDLKNWLNWHAQTSSLQQLLKWIGKSKLSKFKKGVLTAAVVGLVYNIWRTRNEVVWQKA